MELKSTSGVIFISGDLACQRRNRYFGQNQKTTVTAPPRGGGLLPFIRFVDRIYPNQMVDPILKNLGFKLCQPAHRRRLALR